MAMSMNSLGLVWGVGPAASGTRAVDVSRCRETPCRLRQRFASGYRPSEYPSLQIRPRALPAAVSKQTLYKEFTDKASLFRELVLDIGFPDVAASYWEGGFERAIKTLADHFRGLAAAGRLAALDPEIAAQHFAGLLLWIPTRGRPPSGAPTAPPARSAPPQRTGSATPGRQLS